VIAYTFVILRYVHDVGAGEFANVGIVAWSAQAGLQFRVSDRYSRLSKFFADFDGLAYRRVVRHVEDRLRALQLELAQSDLFRGAPASLEEIVHGVVPPDDGAFQWSRVMGGVTHDLPGRVDELFAELVLRHEVKLARERRDEQSMRRAMDRVLTEAGLLARLRRGVEVRGKEYEYSFYAGWSNGTLQVLEPISLDLVNPADMVDKANMWSGRLLNLARAAEFQCTAVIAPPTEGPSLRKLDRALAILQSAPAVRAVVPENRIDQVIEAIRRDISA